MGISRRRVQAKQFFSGPTKRRRLLSQTCRKARASSRHCHQRSVGTCSGHLRSSATNAAAQGLLAALAGVLGGALQVLVHPAGGGKNLSKACLNWFREASWLAPAAIVGGYFSPSRRGCAGLARHPRLCRPRVCWWLLDWSRNTIVQCKLRPFEEFRHPIPYQHHGHSIIRNYVAITMSVLVSEPFRVVLVDPDWAACDCAMTSRKY
jgi:hypothetical protein